MSLKAFHIVFVIFSTLLALGVGGWCISFACALALVIYGIWFYRKMKRLRIIT